MAAWLDELQPTVGHAMRTRALDPADAWATDPDQLAYKRRLLAERHDVVAAALPGHESLLADLEGLAVRVSEDLCLVAQGRLVAGVVCFPSMWKVGDKLGLPVGAIHGPVPGYADQVGAKVDSLLDKLRPERPVWRRNWFVHDTPELHQPEPPTANPSPRVPDDLWLRSERQTLRRLPDSGGILFTIRTDIAPLAEVATRPALAAAMAAAIESWPDDIVVYRQAQHWRDPVLAWLRHR